VLLNADYMTILCTKICWYWNRIVGVTVVFANVTVVWFLRHSVYTKHKEKKNILGMQTFAWRNIARTISMNTEYKQTLHQKKKIIIGLASYGVLGPLNFQLFNFSAHFRAKTNCDIRLHVVDHPVTTV